MPQVVWTDHRRRLVLLPDGTYRLEVKEGDIDAMGKSHWRPTELSWELFTTILQAVLAWKPVTLTSDELQ